MRDVKITIPAGGAKSLPVNLSTGLLLKSVSGVATIDAVIDGARVTLAARDGVNQREFDRVIFENPGGAPAVVTVTVGRGDYRRW